MLHTAPNGAEVYKSMLSYRHFAPTGAVIMKTIHPPIRNPPERALVHQSARTKAHPKPTTGFRRWCSPNRIHISLDPLGIGHEAGPGQRPLWCRRSAHRVLRTCG